MEDARAIENLIYRYAELIDNGELAAVAALFERGAIVSKVHNSRVEGAADVHLMYKHSCRIYPATGTPRTKHLTTNVIIELEDELHASARSYYTVLQATEDLPLQPIITGRYHDSFQKIDNQWYFAEREMFVDLMGDCSQHLLYDPGRVASDAT